MKNVVLLSACLLFVLAGCCQKEKMSSCCESGDASVSCCCNKDSMEVIMNLHRKVKPECIAAFKASFAECTASTLQEPGCLDYGVYQSPADSTEFLIHEHWKNQGELDKHGQTEHLKKHVATTKDMYVSQSACKVFACSCAKK